MTTKSQQPQLESVLPNRDTPWWKKPHLIQLNMCIGTIFLLSGCNGYDASIMNNLQTLSKWQAFMKYPEGAWLGFINAFYWVAVLIYSPCVAWLTNRFGRRHTLMTGYVWLAVATSLQAATPNVAGFIAGRFLLGMTCATYGNTAPLLMAETAYPTHRGIVTALYNTGYHMGSIVAAFSCFGTRNYATSLQWRVPVILQLLCPLVALPGVFLGPESPRWLVSVDRIPEARTMLAKYHAGGDSSSPLVSWELTQITEALRSEREAAVKSSYRQMIQTKGARHRLFITATIGLFAEWVGTNVVGYYLAVVLRSIGITTTTEQTLISAGMSIFNFICAAAGAVSVDRFGRRRLLLLSAVSLFLFFGTFTALQAAFAFHPSAAIGAAVIPFIYLSYGSYSMALNPMLIAYPVEIWPYELRSRGLSVCWVSMVSAIIFNVFVNPIGMAAIGWYYYLVFIFMIVLFGITVYFFYPETTGLSLEEMAEIFDGPGATPVHINGIDVNVVKELPAKESFLVDPKV